MAGALALMGVGYTPAPLSAQTVVTSRWRTDGARRCREQQGRILRESCWDKPTQMAGWRWSARLPAKSAWMRRGFEETTVRLSGGATIRLRAGGPQRAGDGDRVPHPDGTAGKPGDDAATLREKTRHNGGDNAGRGSAAASGGGAFPAIELTGSEPFFAGNEPARAGFDIGEPDVDYRRRCTAERCICRDDPLGRAAGAGGQEHRADARRGERSVWVERDWRGGERGAGATGVQPGPSCGRATAQKVPMTTAYCWKRGVEPGGCWLRAGLWGRMGIFRKLRHSAGRWILPATCIARMAC